jgi:hypothetical protein
VEAGELAARNASLRARAAVTTLLVRQCDAMLELAAHLTAAGCIAGAAHAGLAASGAGGGGAPATGAEAFLRAARRQHEAAAAAAATAAAAAAAAGVPAAGVDAGAAQLPVTWEPRAAAEAYARGEVQLTTPGVRSIVRRFSQVASLNCR